jgi:tetratricopeptide (TPR) repeat protein
MDLPQDLKAPGRPSPDRRLTSWKAIGAFFDRDERTVRRWEIERGLPVHRVPGAGRSGVYAYASELAEWLKTADLHLPEETAESFDPAASPLLASDLAQPVELPRPAAKRRYSLLFLAAACMLMLAVSPIVYRKYLSSRATASTLPKGTKAAANPEAQEFYLQGLYHWNKRTPADLNQAVDDFTQSIVHDPEYAPAYAGLANSYNLMREYTLMPAKEAYPRAIAAAQRAIALDDSLAEAHNSLAFADFYWSWDAHSADHEFQRAIALDPNSVVAHHWYATFLMVLGRSQEALAEIEKARKLDPRSSAILADKGLILFLAGQKEEAVSLLEQLESSEPNFLSPHSYLAVIALATGDYKSYLPEARKSAQLLHDSDRLAIVETGEKGYAAGGGPGMLHAMRDVQQRLYASGKIPAYDLAVTHCLMGNHQEALRLLESSVQSHEAQVIAIRVDKNFQSLHDDPAFQQLIAKVGLPPLA